MKPKNFSLRLKLPLVTVALLTWGFVAGAAGPTSTLYLTAGGEHHNWRILGGTTDAIVSTPTDTANIGESAIAVSDGTVRVAGNGQFGAPSLGSTYDLNFAYIGPRLANPLNNILDGTTDGTYNYGINFITKEVYRCNLDWSSPTFMFTATDVGAYAFGITYEPGANSLWIGDSGGQLIRYSLSGTVLSSFSTPPGVFNWGLAYDGADGTLWALTGFAGALAQFTTTGTELQTIHINTADNIVGAEFALVVPEPSVLSLGSMGIVALLLQRRRLQRSS